MNPLSSEVLRCSLQIRYPNLRMAMGGVECLLPGTRFLFAEPNLDGIPLSLDPRGLALATVTLSLCLPH